MSTCQPVAPAAVLRRGRPPVGALVSLRRAKAATLPGRAWPSPVSGARRTLCTHSMPHTHRAVNGRRMSYRQCCTWVPVLRRRGCSEMPWFRPARRHRHRGRSAPAALPPRCTPGDGAARGGGGIPRTACSRPPGRSAASTLETPRPRTLPPLTSRTLPSPPPGSSRGSLPRIPSAAGSVASRTPPQTGLPLPSQPPCSHICPR